jgi:hypothetical protein
MPGRPRTSTDCGRARDSREAYRPTSACPMPHHGADGVERLAARPAPVGETQCRAWGSNPQDAFASADFKSAAFTISPPRLISLHYATLTLFLGLAKTASIANWLANFPFPVPKSAVSRFRSAMLKSPGRRWL